MEFGHMQSRRSAKSGRGADVRNCHFGSDQGLIGDGRDDIVSRQERADRRKRLAERSL